jgi:hypothetical protein
MAPLVGLTEYPRWWWALLQSLVLVALGVLMSRPPGALELRNSMLLAWCLAAASLPIAYYTTQIFPEILAGALLVIFLQGLLADRWHPGYVLLLIAGLWATPRVAPAVAVASLVIFSPWFGARWLHRGLLTVGWIGFVLTNLLTWGLWLPPMGDSFLTHFLGRLDGVWLLRLVSGLLRALFASDLGLFMLGPIFSVGFVALIHNACRTRARADLLALLIFGATLTGIALYSDYRAGTCPAGRYQVVPALILAWSCVRMGAVGSPTWRRRWWIALLCWGGAGLAITCSVATHANWWFRDYHPAFGRKALQPYYEWLPSFAAGIPWGAILIWVVILAAPWFAYDILRLLRQCMMRKRLQ